jgi:hypothetical protein
MAGKRNERTESVRTFLQNRTPEGARKATFLSPRQPAEIGFMEGI